MPSELRFKELLRTTSEATVTVVFKNNTPELLQVLFAEHGIEQTEIICLNLKSYELQHNVTVMADNRYASYRRDLLSAIHSADTQKEASLLEAKLNQIVSYTSVKEEVER